MTFSRSQRGFTMALALAMAVVMGLMLMKMGPSVVREVQRENESELIFRGEAIATALKLYAAKTGRYPTELEEVMKVRPRILRQLYKDPMTPDGEWQFITQVQAGASGNTKGLPIVGVRSKSTLGWSVHVYQNKTVPSDWQFAAEQNLLGVTDEIAKARNLLNGATGTAAGTTPAPGATGDKTNPTPKE